jgi:O-antigen ligase
MTRPASHHVAIPSDIPASPWRRLTQIAFVLIVAVVIARLTTTEALRDPWEAVPGGMATPRGAGPGTGLVLDLLALLPGVLILARRAFDRHFHLIGRWSYVPMLALGAWAVFSTAWADDRFAAAVTASHWLAGLCLLWAASQLVRDWVHFRLVAAVGFGLLLVLVVQSAIYRTIDVPENVQYWNENKEHLLKERGWQPDSFEARQFEQKLVGGEVFSFFNSANTFAAMGVILLAVSLGIGIQKLNDGDGAGWLALLVVAVAGAGWIIVEARSKTAGATPVLGAAMFLAVALLRSRFKRWPVRLYWLGVAAVVLGLAAVVGHGLYHHGLFPGHFRNSLQFRWEYWVASANMFAHHPLIGVGWSNFGLYYLASRLPAASEEIKDPHNFIVRIFVELGVIGGVLLIGWMLRLWWELTRPNLNSSAPDKRKPPAPPPSLTVNFAVGIAVIGIALGIWANIDFTQIAAGIELEILRRLFYLVALVLGVVAGSMLSAKKRELDNRPAPWLFYCVLIGLGLFLIHNLIDFSLFEVGPMFAFLILAGSALGVAPSRLGKIDEPSIRPRGWAVTGLIIACAIWLTAAAAFVAPVIAAEQSAHDAAEDVRTISTARSSEEIQAQFARAASELRDALDRVPYNADYAVRLARVLVMAGNPIAAEAELARAIRIEPRSIDPYLLRANIELAQPHPNADQIRRDFDEILRLNPNDESLHQQYGQALDRLELPAAAAAQYEKALACNDALPAAEPKRLTSTQIAELRARIRADGER